MKLRFAIRLLVLITLASVGAAMWLASTVVWFDGSPANAVYAIVALGLAAAPGSWADYLDYLAKDTNHAE